MFEDTKINYPQYIIEGDAQRVFRMCVLHRVMMEGLTDIPKLTVHASNYGFHLGTLQYWQRSLKSWQGNFESHIRGDVLAEAKRIYNLIESEAKETKQ